MNEGRGVEIVSLVILNKQERSRCEFFFIIFIECHIIYLGKGELYTKYSLHNYYIM